MALPTEEELAAIIEKELRAGSGHSLRIGASEVVLREHLPIVVERVRQKYPDLQLSLRDAYHPRLEKWLQRREIDLAVTLLDQWKAPGMKTYQRCRARSGPAIHALKR